MLQAVFRGQSAFIFTALIITVGAGVAAFLLSARKSDRPALLGLWVASGVGVACLTLWSTGGSQVAGNCVINRDVFEPFTTEQGLLNLGLFVPVGFLGALATRRVVPAVTIGIVLSAIVETVQGAIPAIGRACDTSDLISNSTGGLLGAFCGWLLIRSVSRSRGLNPWTFKAKPTAFSALGVVVALGAVWGAYIQPHEVTATDAINAASADQRAAAADAVSKAFGDYYTIKSFQYASSPETKNGTIIANLPVGFVQVTWPDRSDITASLDMSDSGAESGFPVPGVTTRPSTAQQAQDIATTYARQHYAWGVPGSRVEVSAVGDNATLGWLVSWRRYHDSVLMPMRLDVQVDRAGRISQLSAREAPDVSVPKVSITKKAAASTALKSMPKCKKAETGELLAVRYDSAWQAVWRVVVSCDDSNKVINVNAHSGAIESQ